MLPSFDELRSHRLIQSQDRAFPRVVYALDEIDAIYLYSVPELDFFLRRDGSVWAAIGPRWRGESLHWEELDSPQRIGVLAHTTRLLSPARVLPELTRLLPDRPADAIACPNCGGDRVYTVILYGVCSRCLDLGWIAPEQPGTSVTE